MKELDRFVYHSQQRKYPICLLMSGVRDADLYLFGTVCVSKDRLNLSNVFSYGCCTHNLCSVELPEWMRVKWKHFSSVRQDQGTVLLCGISVFSSAFKASAYPIFTFDINFPFWVFLPLSKRAGLGDGYQSSAFRWTLYSYQNGVCLA